MTGDIHEFVAHMLYAGIPFQITRAKTYTRVDTDSLRLEFTGAGELRKIGPRPKDLRLKVAS